MRVLVADSDPRVLKALNMLLKCEPELSIIGESRDAASLLAQAKELDPDLVLLDWELPGNSITELIQHLKKARTPCKTVVLSRRPEARQAALTVGADAFVSKTDPADSLLETLGNLLKPPEKDSITVAA
jgi:DNA-binding NarL/FixJ family response regulator